MSEWEASEGEHWATNADRYTRMLAGFGDIADEAAQFMRTTGLGRAVFADAPPDHEAEAVTRATAALVPYESTSGVLMGGAAWLATASA